MARYEKYEDDYDQRSGKLRKLIDKVRGTLRPPRKTTKRAGARLEHDVSKRHRTSEAARSTEFSPLSTSSFDFSEFESQPSFKSTGSSDSSDRFQRSSAPQQTSSHSQSTQPSSPQRSKSRQGASSRAPPINRQPSSRPHPPWRKALAQIPPSPHSDSSHTEVAPLANQPSGFTSPIVGRYYNKEGVQVEVSSDNLPRSVLDSVQKSIKALDLANPDWKAMSFADRCVVKRVISKQTSFKWSKDEGHHAACQTCTNSCSLCLR